VNVTKYDGATAAARARRPSRTTADRVLERELAWRGRSEWDIRREMEAALARRFGPAAGPHRHRHEARAADERT
jgi:hypothetical protein